MAVLRKDSRIDTHGSKHFFQHLFVVIARAENRRNLLCKIDDSGFEADLGVSSVDDTVNFVPKILDHMARLSSDSAGLMYWRSALR